MIARLDILDKNTSPLRDLETPHIEPDHDSRPDRNRLRKGTKAIKENGLTITWIQQAAKPNSK